MLLTNCADNLGPEIRNILWRLLQEPETNFEYLLSQVSTELFLTFFLLFTIKFLITDHS